MNIHGASIWDGFGRQIHGLLAGPRKWTPKRPPGRIHHTYGRLFAEAGELAGTFCALLSFATVYALAINSAGWVIGAALGWIPAILGAGLGYLVGRFLWPVALILLIAHFVLTAAP